MSIQGIQNNAVGGGGEFTTSAPEAAPGPAQPNESEFWAMPGPGQTLEGLRRGALYCLWRDGEIETVSVRRKGKSRGRRLVVASTLRNYLRRLRSEQCVPANKERAK
jgi:hypothetical protein